MKRYVFLVAIGALSLACESFGATTFYVSPSGNDANSGTGPENGDAFKTIQAAVDKLQPGDVCLLRGGVYRETVAFPRSGTADRPIVVKSYHQEKVVLTGLDPITDWTLDKDNIWKASMPWTLGQGRNQVFSAGDVLIEARFPNQPADGLQFPADGLSRLWPTFGEFSIADYKTRPDRLVSKLLEGQPADYWKGAMYYGVHYHGWAAQTGVVESSESGAIQVGNRTSGWWFPLGDPYQPEEGRGMLVGHIHALDQPGEWIWQDNTLHMIPPTKEGPPQQIEAKRRQLALELSNCEHIVIEGVTITAASIRMENSAWCVIDGCDLSYVSHFTLFDGEGSLEKGKDAIKTGEVGIYVGGHDNAFLNCSLRYSAGSGLNIHGYRQTVHNCLIDQTDYMTHYLCALHTTRDEDFLSGGHAFTHNTLSNFGRSAMSFSPWGCFSRNGGPSGNQAFLFAHNHVFNGMMQGRDGGFLTGYFSDGGSFNDTSSQVVYNVFHDSFDRLGLLLNILGIIYLDEGTSHVDLHHNLLWAKPGSLQQGMWFNTCCVRINDHDNVFHRQFERSAAQLTPEDFPEGKPFRFGHDCQNRPPRPTWPQIERQPWEAETCSAMSPGAVKNDRGVAGLKDGDWIAFDNMDLDAGWRSMVMRFASDAQEMNTDLSARVAPRHRKATDPLILESTVNDGAASNLRVQWKLNHNISSGDWLKFDQVPFGEGYRRFRVVYGNNRPGRRWAELHLDNIDGPIAATIELPPTEHWEKDRIDQLKEGYRIQRYQEAVGELSPDAVGARDVVVVFRSDDDKPVCEVEYFRFEQYRGAIPLQNKEVKLEIRVGSPTGEKIGEFYPRCTGGSDLFRETIATLEPATATGRQKLFLVVRSAVAKPLGTIDSISLERAKQPLDTTGLGIQ